MSPDSLAGSATLGAAGTAGDVPSTPGDLLDGRYRLVCELGAGGMGVVMLGEDVRLKRRVAIKFLRTIANDADMARFSREAQLLASFSHPNVVKVFDYGEQDGRPYFVMEYVEGPTLADLLEQAPEGLPVDVALGFGRQLCEALAAVHRQGIIHRDIKPGNILVEGGTRALLMDFGLAREDAGHREGGMVSGTPQYLPPEDIRGQPLQGEAARRSDIYALGITLYELIAGRPPFMHENVTVILHQQVFDAPTPLSDLRPDVPPAFERVIMKALEKDPARRQANCDELVVELREARYEASHVLTPPPQMAPISSSELSVPRTVEIDAPDLPVPVNYFSFSEPFPERLSMDYGTQTLELEATPTRVMQPLLDDDFDTIELEATLAAPLPPIAPAPPHVMGSVTAAFHTLAPLSAQPLAALPGPGTPSAPPRPAPAPALPLVALVTDGGPMRERIADGIRQALGVEVRVLPMAGRPILEGLRQIAAGCVALDLDLIEENAFELIAALRATPATARMPIVVLGDDPTPDQIALLTRMGIDDVLERRMVSRELPRRIADSLRIAAHVAARG